MKYEITKDNIEENFHKRYDNFPYIGILWYTDNLKKTFIIRNETGESVGISPKELSLKYKWVRPSNYDYCKEVFNKNTKNKIYMFDTAEELLEWLSNNNTM